MSLYCICHKPEKGFMILCDACQQWFHGTCVQVTKKLASTLHEWFCLLCAACRRLESLEGKVEVLQSLTIKDSQTANCQALTKRIDQLEETHSQLKFEYNQLQAKCSKACQEKDALEMHNQSMKRKFSDLEDYQSALQDSYKKVCQEIVEIKNENKNFLVLKAKQTAAAEELSILQSKCNHLEGEFLKVSEERDALQEKYEHVCQEAENLRNQLNQLKNRKRLSLKKN